MTTIQAKPFIDAYIECLLWSSLDDNNEPLDSHYTFDDLSPQSVSRISCECSRFLWIAGYYNINLSGLEAQAGHDFWLTRNGHGTGFWDRPEVYGKENARLLSIMSDCFGMCAVFVSDDKIEIE